MPHPPRRPAPQRLASSQSGPRIAADRAGSAGHADDPLGSPTSGQVFGGRFRVERQLGVGGMGAVYAADDLVSGVRVALKLMHAKLASDRRAVERFRREGAALAAVRHPAVVQIREVGALEDGALYIAMELLEGETLAAHLERTGPMRGSALLPIVLGLCDGLAAAHAGGVIHRDVKPSNIHLPDVEALAHAERTRSVAPVKLVDFGVARVRGFSKVTSSGMAVGTIGYMAPEQLTGGAIDERVDVYALGVVLYEALAGEHPFERTGRDDMVGTILIGRITPLSSLRPDLPPALTRVVHGAMARLPTERIASASALADAFRSALDGGAESVALDEDRPTLVSPSPQAAVESALGPTLAATPVRIEARVAAESAVLPKHPKERKAKAKKPRSRAALWVALTVVLGLCAGSGAITAGAVGCNVYLTDMQIRLGLQKVRGAIADHELPELRTEVDQLEALHHRDGVSFFAAAAFNARIQKATESDDRLDREELRWVMALVRDILARDGQYDMERYAKMTQSSS